jgi:predicted RNA-binding Zn ribbon-like protein
MGFADDTSAALLAAVDLVNSAEPPDALVSLAELDAFFTRHSYTGARTHDAAELAAVRSLRPALRAVLTAGRDRAVPLVNRLLADANATPRLERHDSLDWHVHAVSDDSPLATRIAVETAMAMIDMIRADETSRLAVCADADCDGIVLDLSRNRSRKFCSLACGNRNAVASYRARKARQAAARRR